LNQRVQNIEFPVSRSLLASALKSLNASLSIKHIPLNAD